MKVCILGVTGMLGSEVARYFSKHTSYDIVRTARAPVTPDIKLLDAENFTDSDLEGILTGCDYVINCIGIIKTYIHDDNNAEVCRAIQVNALFPHRLSEVSRKCGAKVIQIATDCVYDGQKGSYTENDVHNALDVYGKSKSLGEVRSGSVMNLRCSIIGKEEKGKTSLLEWFLNQPQGAQLRGFTNHFWNGVTTQAFARICAGIIAHDLWRKGMWHVVPADVVNKAQMLRDFARIFDREDVGISDYETMPGIDRSIATTHPEFNEALWKAAGYDHIPAVTEMIENICQC